MPDINEKVLSIVPGRTDKEVAENFRARLVEAHEPILKILDEMKESAFQANVGCGLGPLGKFVITNLQVFKTF